jgi:putative peptidoglycan lipid II flippase
MIRRLKFWDSEFTVARAATIIGLFTLATKISALFRERLFAAAFGQGQISDSYFAAFRVPDFVTNLFVLSTLSVAFLPVFSKEKTKDPASANAFANTTLDAALIFISLVCLLLLIFSRPLTQLLVPGFSGEQFFSTLQLTRLFLITPIIFAASTVFGGVLNAHKKFLITSFAPLLYNLGIIAGIVFLYPKFGIMGLGYGVLLGGLAQLLIQLAGILASGFKWQWNPHFKTPVFMHMLKLYTPRILTFDLANVTLILSTILASKALSGSITAINQSFNLQSVPVGIFAYALASAIFPVLSEEYAKNDEPSFVKSLQNTIRQIIYLMVPVTVFMIVFRAFIVRLILGSGNFTWENTITTLTFLGIFSVSLLSQSLTTLFSRAFYSRHNTKVPVIANLWSIGLNVLLSIFLFKYLKAEGLVISFVVASFFNAGFLLVVLRRNLIKECGKALISAAENSLWDNFLKVFLSAMVSGGVSYIALRIFEPLVNTQTFIGILIQSGLSGFLGVVSYVALTSVLKLPESKNILNIFRK